MNMRDCKWLSLAALLGALCVLGGCADKPKREKPDDTLVALVKALSGSYEHPAGSEDDGTALLVAPTGASLLGIAVFYVRESVLGDPRRVLMQRLWSISIDDKKRLVQKLYVLKEPRRWLQAADNPELLQSVLEDDVTELSDCELIWKRTADGFEANAGETCTPGSAMAGRSLEHGLTLHGTVLAIAEQKVDVDGKLLNEAAQWYAFQRNAHSSSAANDRN